jgi:maltooligosyltrehalose trehalohydrolase
MGNGVQGRRLPVGAEAIPGGGVSFRVWAPGRRRVGLVLGQAAPRTVDLGAEPQGYFSGTIAEARPGSLYRYRLDGESYLYPDPASRFQPEGPHGPSQVVDPSVFHWTDHAWHGLRLEGQVFYEMHLGTFTPEGTLESAIRQLPELASAGITVVELMPVAEFPGSFGWGYDGVDLFAPSHLYGHPDDLRRFVDSAHSVGVGVVLDVVYNHLGPDGNYLKQFSLDYFTDRYENEWGEAINFDGEESDPVREFFIANARYWIDEFHMDGLRLDATHQVFDNSPEHILAAISRHTRKVAAGRSILLVAENESQRTRLAQPLEEGGYGLDALWNDDYHHSAMVAMTGQNEAYYGEYLGRPQELISAIKRGYLYQGQRYYWQDKRRGSPTRALSPATFVTFIQNHDQIANSASGLRCHQLTSPGLYRAFTALTLLAPGTPLLFQGEEFAASSPFLYFADHNPELARLVAKGRREFLSQFPSIATPEIQALLPDPSNLATFERCRLDLSEREKHLADYTLHKDLLKLRREDPVFRSQGEGGVDGAVLAERAFVLRFFAKDGDDRLVLVNLGLELCLRPAPEPLLAPPEGVAWETVWSSEDPRYGGLGTPAVDTDEYWRIRGESLVVLKPMVGGQAAS